MEPVEYLTGLNYRFNVVVQMRAWKLKVWNIGGQFKVFWCKLENKVDEVQMICSVVFQDQQ